MIDEEEYLALNKRRVQQRARRIQKEQNVKYTIAYRAAQKAILLEKKIAEKSAQ